MGRECILNMSPSAEKKRCRLWTLLLLLLTIVASNLDMCLGDEEIGFHEMSRYKRDIIPTADTTKKTLRVVTIQELPFVNISQGNNSERTYSGFYVDLLREICPILGVVCELYPSPDGRYGAPTADGQTWTGMVGELHKTKYDPGGNLSEDTTHNGADLALAPITINVVRETVVDFLHPLSRQGLTVMVQKKYLRKDDPIIPFDFGVFMPMTPTVWGFIIATVLVVASLLCLMNHFNPYEWGNRTNLGLASQHHKESFNFSGSLWFAFSTMQWQGFERAPRSLASKALTCFWFFFITITLVTYTGAFINNMWWSSLVRTQNPFKYHVESLAELLSDNNDDTKFKIGCIRGASTYSYIKYSHKMEFRMLANYWETAEGDATLVSSEQEAISRMRSERYAFIGESLFAKYITNKLPCDITTVGEDFGLRSYAFAVPKNSPYRVAINQALLKLNEDGRLEKLEQKWWEGRGECWNYTQVEKTFEKATAMYISQAQPKVVDLEMYWGVLVVMVAGIVVCLFTAIVEIVYYRYKGRYKESNRPQGQTLNLDNEDGNI